MQVCLLLHVHNAVVLIHVLVDDQFNWPGQVVLRASQVYWTQECAQAISEKGAKHVCVNWIIMSYYV